MPDQRVTKLGVAVALVNPVIVLKFDVTNINIQNVYYLFELQC